MTDYNIIGAEISKGNQQAFDSLFHSLYPELCKYATRFFDLTEDAEDVVQQCFINLLNNKDAVASVDNLRAYLYRSVYNLSLNKLEKSKIRETHYSAFDIELRNLYESDFENTYDPELIDRMHKEIDQLPEKNKEVFKLRFYSGLTAQETGEVLGISSRTVEKHVARAFKMLKERLQPAMYISLLALIISDLLRNS